MHHIEELQLYISDRCDMSCDGCITYNNWSWGSRLSIAAHRDNWLLWRDQITVGSLTILGGEPMLNPELAQWIGLIQSLAICSQLRVCTNGAHQDRWDPAWTEQGVVLEISAHSPEDLARAEAWCRAQWPHSRRTESRAEGSAHAVNRIIQWHSAGVLLAEVREAWQFNQWPWRLAQGQITWDQLRDPKLEYEHCLVKDCAYMMGSRLYRCPQQALFPRITPWVTEQYAAVTALDLGVSPDESVDQWMEKRFSSDSQCSLCNWQQPWTQALDTPRKAKITLVPRAEYQSKQLNT